MVMDIPANTSFMLLPSPSINCKVDKDLGILISHVSHRRWHVLFLVQDRAYEATQISYHFSQFANCYFISWTEQSVLTVSVHHSPLSCSFSKNIEMQTKFLKVFPAHLNHSQVNTTKLAAGTEQVAQFTGLIGSVLLATVPCFWGHNFWGDN